MEVHSHLPDDASTPSDIPGGGSGQVGMRERLALYGGNLQIDRSATEYCVRATIPHRGDVHGPEDEVR
jgi:glucose-6-phosphate-specific signal transduction histidine kinase